MAPIDFEKNMAEKLAQREIQPSEKAWEKIASRLEEAPSRTSRRPGPWMYAVAAGLLLLLGIYQGLKTATSDPDLSIETPVAVQPSEDQPSLQDERRQKETPTEAQHIVSPQKKSTAQEGVARVADQADPTADPGDTPPPEAAIPELKRSSSSSIPRMTETGKCIARKPGR